MLIKLGKWYFLVVLNYDQICILQEIQVQPSARTCYVLLALFREITTSFSHVNKEDKIPARVGFSQGNQDLAYIFLNVVWTACIKILHSSSVHSNATYAVLYFVL